MTESVAAAQEAVTETVVRATINSLADHIAILDKDGEILAVNEAWERFSQDNSGGAAGNTGVGANYLQVCRQAVQSGEEGAEEVLLGLQAVLEGGHVEFSRQYPCHSDNEQRWFAMHASPLNGGVKGAIVAHKDITVQVTMERLLQESESRYQDLFHHLPVGLFSASANGQILDSNQALVEMLGYPNQQALQSACLSDIFPDSNPTPRWRQAMERRGRAPFFEAQARRWDGSLIWVRTTLRPVRGSEDELLYHEGTVEDITVRRQVEENLIRIESFHQDLVQNLTEGIALLNPDGHFTFINAAAAGLVGHSPDELVGEHWRAVIPPEHHPKIEAAETRRKQGKQDRYEVELLHKDGHRIPVMIHGLPLVEEGSFNGTLAVITDMSQPKRIESALRDSELRYRMLFENASMGVGVADLDGNLLAFNQAILAPGGYTREEIAAIGNVSNLYYDTGARAEVLDLVQKQGHLMRHRVQFRRKDGSPYDALLSLVPTTFEGRPCWQALVEDITDQVQHERERESLLTVAASLRQAESTADMLPIILNQMMHLLDAGGAAIALLDENSNELIVELAMGGWSHVEDMRIPPGEGMSGAVFSSCEPYHSADVSTDPRFIRPDLLGELRAVICAPLIAQAGPIGTLALASRRPFSPGDVRLLMAVADMAANAIQRARLHESEHRRLERLDALRAIDRAITSSVDLRLPLEVLMDQVMGQLQVDAAAVWVSRPEAHSLELFTRRGFQTAHTTPRQLRLGEGLAGRVVVKRETLRMPKLGSQVGKGPWMQVYRAEGFDHYLGIPLLTRGEVVGVLEVFHREPFEPAADWLDYLQTFGGQAAIAIDNATLFERLQRSNLEMGRAFDTTLEGWSRALELRDQETEGHAERVNDLTLRLARSVGIPDEDLVHVRRGALLHDIGKMAIPDSILFKPGPLSDDEWDIMRQHPVYAQQLLAPIPFLRPALDIPYCHHEKWDGSGYPRGLQGEAIPLAARVFAVVDVWDALRSDRPYRPAWSEARALQYLREQAGAHFDPHVVPIFLEMVNGRAETPPA